MQFAIPETPFVSELLYRFHSNDHIFLMAIQLTEAFSNDQQIGGQRGGNLMEINPESAGSRFVACGS